MKWYDSEAAHCLMISNTMFIIEVERKGERYDLVSNIIFEINSFSASDVSQYEV